MNVSCTYIPIVLQIHHYNWIETGGRVLFGEYVPRFSRGKYVNEAFSILYLLTGRIRTMDCVSRLVAKTIFGLGYAQIIVWKPNHVTKFPRPS